MFEGDPSSCPDLEKGSGYRNDLNYIEFKSPFTSEPKVIVGLSMINGSKNGNLRISAKAKEITCKGFALEVSTWMDTHIFGYEVSWLAYED